MQATQHKTYIHLLCKRHTYTYNHKHCISHTTLDIHTLSTFENACFLARNNKYLANSQIDVVLEFRSDEATF